MADPILHLLGLAKKAGKLEIGEEPVGAVCRAHRAKLLLLAADAAPNTCRRAAHFGQAGNVLFLTLPQTKAEIGFQLGRNAVAMMALVDSGFAGAIGEKLAALDPEQYAAAASQLSQKAERQRQRQKEQRQHEKNLQRKAAKPWSPPPKKREAPKSAQATRIASGTGGSRAAPRLPTKGSRLTVKRNSGHTKSRKP